MNQLTCMDVFPPLRGPIKSIRGRSAILGSSKLVLVEPLPPLPLPLPLPLLLLPEEVAPMLPTEVAEPAPVASGGGGCCCIILAVPFSPYCIVPSAGYPC